MNMKYSIFFSWQSDTDSAAGRNFIERALERAIRAIGFDTEVEAAVREGLEIDRDTRGVAGWPPIVDTIFKKIDCAAVFVADMTFAGRRPLDNAPIPNPNVLIEYGWALKSLGHARIVAVMNTAYGNPRDEEMPFDMRHLRHPIQYCCAEDADANTRTESRRLLAKELEGAIRTIIDSDDFKASLPKPQEPPAFQQRVEPDRPGHFRARGQPLGISDGHFPGSESQDVYLEDNPAIWFRVMPTIDPGKRWSLGQIKKAATFGGALLTPMNDGGGNFGFVRAEDGFGVHLVTRNATCSVVFAFDTGELWTIDTFPVATIRQHPKAAIPLDEIAFTKKLEEFSTFLERLGIARPHRWIAGIDGLKGLGLWLPPPPKGHSAFPSPRGNCVVNCVSESGLYMPRASSRESLRPFFEAIYDKCGLERPAFLNE